MVADRFPDSEVMGSGGFWRGQWDPKGMLCVWEGILVLWPCVPSVTRSFHVFLRESGNIFYY